MLKIHFMRRLFQVGERKRKMNNKSLNSKNEKKKKKNNNCATPAEKGNNRK